MTAYIVFLREMPPHDPEGLKIYQAINREHVPVYQAHGIKPLSVYGNAEALEGTAPDGTVILAFPTMADAKAWYQSPEYQSALPHRIKASDYRAFIVEGL
jgi:uncharacterized protein (DUF1330 family)